MTVEIVEGVPVSPSAAPLALRVAHVAQANVVSSASDGDLWPSAWASDGHLYAACGDGTGFARHGWSDIAVNRIAGTPDTGFTGMRLAYGDQIAPQWHPSSFNRKPTGMACVRLDDHDVLFMAVQYLRCSEGPDMFNEAPAATIVRSDDLGHTWHWPAEPVFDEHVFTTVMFLDLGQANGGVDWLYAYGIDGNWRTSYSKIVPDPTALYLGRVRPDQAQDKTAWEFYAGSGADGVPRWTSDIGEKRAVLTDDRRFYPVVPPGDVGNGTCIAQGSVVWNPGLKCYLYSTWSEYTIELFQAPAPWGPWWHLLSKDFGHYPWRGPRDPLAKHGGYATTIPSKFISADGTLMWMQSNWFYGASSRGGRAYCFGLRPVCLDPGAALEVPVDGNLAMEGAWPIVSRLRDGQESVLNDGTRLYADDTANGPGFGDDRWGYTWAAPRRMARLIFSHGGQDSMGGWFEDGPRLEVRRYGRWVAATTVRITPSYPRDFTALERDRYVVSFDPVIADGIRLVGAPGGVGRYTSMSEIEVWWS